MSQKDQVEKNLAFQCWAKMVWWLHLRSPLHILTHQITTLNDWRYTLVPIVFDAVWGYLGVSEGEYWCIWWYIKMSKLLWESLEGYLGVETMQNWAMLKQPHHFGTRLKCKIFSTCSFWDIEIPKPPHISFLKIIGSGHFLHFCGSSERYHLLQLLWITLY